MGNFLLDMGVLVLIVLIGWILGTGFVYYPFQTIVFLVCVYMYYYYRSRAIDEKVQPYVQQCLAWIGKRWRKRFDRR